MWLPSVPRSGWYDKGRTASPDEDPFGFCMGPDAAFDGSMCRTTQQDDAISMSFVGNGKGEYIQETVYRFVGDGVGEFGPEPPGFCARWGTFIGSSAVMSVLLALVLASLGGLQPTGFPRPSSSSSDGIAFDCEVDYTDWEKKWSVDRQRWCCHQFSRACQSGERPQEAASPVLSTAVQPYDCDPKPDWNATWTEGQKAWCCKHIGLGCQPLPTQHPPRVPRNVARPLVRLQTSTSQPGIASTIEGGVSAGFHGERAPGNVANGNRSQTQEFAQAAKSVTSEIQPVPEVAIPLPSQTRMKFDCSSSPEVWAFTKQVWCCQHTGKACPTASPAAPGVPIAPEGNAGTISKPELRSLQWWGSPRHSSA